ncbi:MAG TPA: nicotinate-nucleotide adenylyltransferase [Chromatiales bacterium]|nr:nicotinate-nucleotide adenylyltransferase [Chromatiales bacterium]
MIGVYGGMFDPVHFGHLRPALEVQQALGLEELRFVPVGQPPHRHPPRADAELRVAMLQAAIAGQPGFVLDERELTRPGPSYMVDTLGSLRAEAGDVPLCLILGSDAFLGLPGWHRWTRLIELAHLVVAHRPGWSLEDRNDTLRELVAQHRLAPDALAQRPAGGVCFVAVTQLDISSTRIREQVRAGQDVRYLLPDPVRALIQQNHLYR